MVKVPGRLFDALSDHNLNPIEAIPAFLESMTEGEAVFRIGAAVLARLLKKPTFNSLVDGIRDALHLTKLLETVPRITKEVNEIRNMFQGIAGDLAVIGQEPHFTGLVLHYELLKGLPSGFGVNLNSLGTVNIDAGIAQYQPSGQLVIDPWPTIEMTTIAFPPKPITVCGTAVNVEPIKGDVPTSISCGVKTIDVKKPPNWVPYLRLRFD